MFQFTAPETDWDRRTARLAGTGPDRSRNQTTGAALKHSPPAQANAVQAAGITPWPPVPAPRPESGRTDVVQLILANHARIRRLLDTVNSAARYDPTRARLLAEVWDRAADLLSLDCDAEEEICYPALFGVTGLAAEIGDGMADHEDIRMAIDETRIQETGSSPWWRAVTATAHISDRHFTWEQRSVLPEVRRHTSPSQRRTLGRQWAAFATARSLDAADTRAPSCRSSWWIERW